MATKANKAIVAKAGQSPRDSASAQKSPRLVPSALAASMENQNKLVGFECTSGPGAPLVRSLALIGQRNIGREHRR